MKLEGERYACELEDGPIWEEQKPVKRRVGAVVMAGILSICMACGTTLAATTDDEYGSIADGDGMIVGGDFNLRIGPVDHTAIYNNDPGHKGVDTAIASSSISDPDKNPVAPIEVDSTGSGLAIGTSGACSQFGFSNPQGGSDSVHSTLYLKQSAAKASDSQLLNLLEFDVYYVKSDEGVGKNPADYAFLAYVDSVRNNYSGYNAQMPPSKVPPQCELWNGSGTATTADAEAANVPYSKISSVGLELPGVLAPNQSATIFVVAHLPATTTDIKPYLGQHVYLTAEVRGVLA
ncbi:MAG: hypothetical protein LBR21_02275 [Propionibacteriaceae bacterium]|jgi:hypothetical protein|nr:hypothetical protein [Propionibacteriaceae bacterium]